MPEEYNRRVADHLSTHLYAPTLDNAGTLVGERVPGEVFVTGNTVIDACLANLPAALQKSDALARMDLEPNGYALATVHRAENVDDPKTLGKLIDIFEGCPLPVVLPLHPRTVKNARRFGLWKRLRPSKNISVVEPVGYWDFLALMKGSGLVLTDSGGIQEEVTAPNIRRKCFVLRTSTERQEAIRAGFCELAGVEPSGALMAVRKWWDGGARVPNRASPFGRGDSAGKIVRILMKKGFC
jgi:UDP-N-acetylglucosamine 2-epimerase (non-hydrolysing)